MSDRTVRRTAWIVALLALVSTGVVLAQQREPSSSGAQQDVRALLDSIRDDLVELRFEKALAAIEAVLGQPGMTEAERGEALILRAQAHAAFGDFDGVERDYGEILRLQPAYVPEASLTPTKAMERYNKVKARMIGKIKVELDPPDARLFVDGAEVAPDPAGLVMLLAGTHRLRAERSGNDPHEQVVEVVANKQTAVSIRLVPNARTVVVRTDPEGVDVRLDGQPVGKTERPQALVGAGAPAAELVIENVPLGEHVFELSKECFRTQRLTDTLTVDLLDRSPKRYKTVRMVGVRALLSLQGGPSGADVVIDGRRVTRLPSEPIDACPGRREVAVELNGRVVWSETTELQEAEDRKFEVEPRPNVALVGAESWPRQLAGFGAGFNVVRRIDLPSGADLSTAEGWRRLKIPSGTDLGFAVVPSRRQGGTDRWYLYSPILREVVSLESAPPVDERPAWTTVSWGLITVDDDERVSTLVVEVVPGGPAEGAGLAPGDRIVSVAGREVTDTKQLRALLAQSGARGPVRVQWLTAEGESREAELSGKVGPLLVPGDDRKDVAMVHAAWAVADSHVTPEQTASALANLGLLFLEHGHFELAVDTWRRVDWGNRRGVGEGTKQYYLGRALELEGREAEATAAYQKAVASQSTAFTDDGPPIAPAARDRLADLGVAVNQ